MDTGVLDEQQRVVSLNKFILQRYGIVLNKNANILDFGCGAGRHTYEYLDAGYDRVVGFDVQNYVRLREQTDSEHFCFSETDGSYRIPFPDNYFDFITSTSVFEHVFNQGEVIAEIARVLKPDGATLHVFPSRWRPVEPHIFVPFGGAIQTRCWLSFWAHMSIRNGFQRDLSVQETVSRNVAYCETGICYPDFDTIDSLWRNEFSSVDYSERAFLEGARHVSTVSRLVCPLIKAVPVLLRLYRFAHTRVVLARSPFGGQRENI